MDGKIKVTESGIEFTSPKTMDMAHDVAIHYLELLKNTMGYWSQFT